MTLPLGALIFKRSRTHSHPILVTGVPRSGTTWLARSLAQAKGGVMPGREPMNPHFGQYRLAGTLRAWTRLDRPTLHQQRALRRVFRGWDPRAYGRYGLRQWRALLPGARIVVKDPFALLSIASIAALTNALPVLVYRHPAAVLASYRRMGWSPDVSELAAISGTSGADVPVGADDVDEMVYFWNTLHTLANEQLRQVPRALIVSHAELAGGGGPALRRLYAACNLEWSSRVEADCRQETPADTADSDALHVLNRAPSDVANSWRGTISAADVARLETGTAEVFAGLEAARRVLV